MSILRRKKGGSPPDEPSEAGEGEQPTACKWPGFRESFKGTADALSGGSKRQYLVAGLGLTVILVIGILAFSGASFWWTSRPSFCNRCHIMTPYIQAWEQSPHKDVNCEACHMQPGFFGFLGGKIAALQVVANYIQGNYTDSSFNAAVMNSSCLQCHEDIMDGVIEANGLYMDHASAIKNGSKCMYCHSTVAHGSSVGIGSRNYPSMDTCMVCHNGQTASSKCETCHVSGIPTGGAKPQSVYGYVPQTWPPSPIPEGQESTEAGVPPSPSPSP
jgi:nitrate/TMAO reductase-like tetraheme cytochrome c subunit